MDIKLSSAMLASIDEHIVAMRGNHNILDVYKTAEIIRLTHINENVAREDIIEKLVLRAGSNTPLEFNTPDDELDDLTEFLDGPGPDLLVPLSTFKLVH